MKRKVSRWNKFGLVAFLPRIIKSLGVFNIKYPNANCMGVTDPKFVKGGRKLKRVKHCTIPKTLIEDEK